MKRRISMVLLTCLALAPAASAHELVPRTIVVHEGLVVVAHRGAAPPWLRAHRPFQRWYRDSHHRYAPRMSWIDLYDLYRLELRHSRPVRHVHRRGCKHLRNGHHRHFSRKGRNGGDHRRHGHGHGHGRG